MNTIYSINRAIDKPIVFKGLKSQYIWYLGIGIALLLLVFAMLYIMGAPLMICIALIACAGTGLFIYVYKMNNKYGEHGMMKHTAARGIPKRILCDQLFKK